MTLYPELFTTLGGTLMGWLASLTLEDKARQGLSLPRVVCEYEDVFSNELSELPLYRDVDFTIELNRLFL